MIDLDDEPHDDRPKLPKCQTCWGTIQPDEERRVTPTQGLPLIHHADYEICALLTSEDASLGSYSTPDYGPRLPPKAHPDDDDIAA